MKRYYIGVDIGGTNTDVVLIDQAHTIVGAKKEITSQPLQQSAVAAIVALLQECGVPVEEVVGLFFGTTHATNAILQAQDLLGVGLIRIAGHRPDSSPCFFWPKELRGVVLQAVETIDGGCECDGSAITPFDVKQAELAVRRLLAQGVSAISVVGAFSPIDPTQELAVAKCVYALAGADFPVSLSHEIGGIGFLERENATLLNSSLKKVIADGFSALENSMRALGITCPLYMVQNDGSIMDMQHAIKMPILTIAAGQTNSFVGGCKVANTASAVVVDIGGTSTDIGIVIDGVPKRSCHATQIGGVELHFAMPDALSLALGGGSLIEGTSIGPKSVARRLKSEAQCFGGGHLTFTDVGIYLGILDIPGAERRLIKLSEARAKELLRGVQEKLLYTLQLAMGNKRDLPVVVVGGAAKLVQAALQDTVLESNVLIPPHSDVANAYGAALSEVSSTTTIVAPLATGREALLEKIKAKTCEQAILKGAEASLTRIVNVDIIPYAYSKDGLAKVTVTALGPRQ